MLYLIREARGIAGASVSYAMGNSLVLDYQEYEEEINANGLFFEKIVEGLKGEKPVVAFDVSDEIEERAMNYCGENKINIHVLATEVAFLSDGDELSLPQEPKSFEFYGVKDAATHLRGIDFDLLDEIFISLDHTLLHFTDHNSLNFSDDNLTLNPDVVEMLQNLSGQEVYVFCNQLAVGEGDVTYEKLLEKLQSVSELLEEYGVEYLIKSFYIAVSEDKSIRYEPFSPQFQIIDEKPSSPMPDPQMYYQHLDRLPADSKNNSRVFVGSAHDVVENHDYLFAKATGLCYIPVELLFLLNQ